MKRIPREKRYNARGDRACHACSKQAGRLVYLPVDHFRERRATFDGLCSSCRSCENRQQRARRVPMWADDARWQADLAYRAAWKRARSAKRNEAKYELARSAVTTLRDRGFTLLEIADLSGVSQPTVSSYFLGGKKHCKDGVVNRLMRTMLATSDLPIVGPPPRIRGRHPHPDLGLVRARLDRMAYLAELEEAA